MSDHRPGIYAAFDGMSSGGRDATERRGSQDPQNHLRELRDHDSNQTSVDGGRRVHPNRRRGGKN
ncbi:MAG: hypothetical protein NT069_20220 [Planctomycetota bacterium]|nr:hypothetical protein [Planctomycetota bacterium]